MLVIALYGGCTAEQEERITMIASIRFMLVLSVLLASAAPAAGQDACPSTACLTCPCGQTYRIVYQTVYEQQQYTAYRVEYETVCEQRPVTTYQPIWETAVRENRYTVARPVMETAVHDEAYTVQRPIYETAVRDESYTVMKPVYETAYRTECHTVLQPVTTYLTQYVDQGCFHEQTVMKPALPVTRLTWQSGTCGVDPVTGQTVYQRAGLYWVQTPRTVCEVQKVWCPNVVAQQVPQTTFVPQTVTQQVPVQVCKYVPEQVCRKVPVQVCRMVTEQCVRKVPVTTCRMVYEQRVERVPYQVCRMVAQQGVVQVPHCVEKRIPVTYTCNVPRLVCYRVPLDACGEPIAAVATEAAPAAVLAPPAIGTPPVIGAAPTRPAWRRQRRNRRSRRRPRDAQCRVEAGTWRRGRRAPAGGWGREPAGQGSGALKGGAPADKDSRAGTGGLSVQVALSRFLQVWNDGRTKFAPNGRVPPTVLLPSFSPSAPSPIDKYRQFFHQMAQMGGATRL